MARAFRISKLSSVEMPRLKRQHRQRWRSTGGTGDLLGTSMSSRGSARRLWPGGSLPWADLRPLRHKCLLQPLCPFRRHAWVTVHPDRVTGRRFPSTDGGRARTSMLLLLQCRSSKEPLVHSEVSTSWCSVSRCPPRWAVCLCLVLLLYLFVF